MKQFLGRMWQGFKGFLSTLADAATVDQYMGLLRQAIPAIGMLMIALGWITPGQLSDFTAKFLGVVGPILLAAGAIWSLIANSQYSIRKAAAKLPENQDKP